MFAGQIYHSPVQLLDHFRSQQLSDANQGFGIGHFLATNPCEIAIHQVGSHFALQHVVAPVPRMLQNQQSEHNLSRRLLSSAGATMLAPLRLCVVDIVQNRLVFQQTIRHTHPWLPEVGHFLPPEGVTQAGLPMP
jgi:hypothetical protein